VPPFHTPVNMAALICLLLIEEAMPVLRCDGTDYILVLETKMITIKKLLQSSCPAREPADVDF